MTNTEQQLFDALHKLHVLTRSLEVSKLGGAVTEAHNEAGFLLDSLSDHRPGSEAAIMAMESGIDYSTCLAMCNCD